MQLGGEQHSVSQAAAAAAAAAAKACAPLLISISVAKRIEKGNNEEEKGFRV
jgi:hypothetical protein